MSESEEIAIEEAEAPGDGWWVVLACGLFAGWLVLMMYLTTPRLGGSANANKASSDTKAIYSAAQQYRMTHRRIPTIEDLKTPDAKGRAYLESLSDDPWGQPYVIRETDGYRFQVVSFGEDLKEGTEDDIVSPRRARRGG